MNPTDTPQSSDLTELLDVLDDVLAQACWDYPRREWDSMSLSAYADGLRLLARYGRLKIHADVGRRVIARRHAPDETGGS